MGAKGAFFVRVHHSVMVGVTLAHVAFSAMFDLSQSEILA
jgi:hypothetical protein